MGACLWNHKKTKKNIHVARGTWRHATKELVIIESRLNQLLQFYPDKAMYILLVSSNYMYLIWFIYQERITQLYLIN